MYCFIRSLRDRRWGHRLNCVDFVNTAGDFQRDYGIRNAGFDALVKFGFPLRMKMSAMSELR